MHFKNALRFSDTVSNLQCKIYTNNLTDNLKNLEIH
jgi:hypothetical protein